MFILALVLASLTQANAQTIDTTQVSITLKARHHAYLIGFMYERSDVDKIRYINQLASQITDTADREKMVTVTVPESLVVRLYTETGMQPERLTTTYNDEIKKLLLPQIADRPNLLAAIQRIAVSNDAEREQRVSYGFRFLKQISQ